MIRHIAGFPELFQRQHTPFLVVDLQQPAERRIPQRPPGHRLRGRLIGTRIRIAVVAGHQLFPQTQGKLVEHSGTSLTNALHISGIIKFKQVRLTGKLQHFGNHCLIQICIGQQMSVGGHQPRFDWRFAGLSNQRLDHINRETLARIPTIKSVGIVIHQEH